MFGVVKYFTDLTRSIADVPITSRDFQDLICYFCSCPMKSCATCLSIMMSRMCSTPVALTLKAKGQLVDVVFNTTIHVSILLFLDQIHVCISHLDLDIAPASEKTLPL